MRITNNCHDYSWCSLVIRNDVGEQFSEIDCPSALKERIFRALSHGEQSGMIGHAGNLWRWRHVNWIEFEREGRVVERFAADWTWWQTFKLTAYKHGFDPRQWLATHIVAGTQQGWTALEVLELLFSPEDPETQAWAESLGEDEAPLAMSPEIERFEEVSQMFHRGEAQGLAL